MNLSSEQQAMLEGNFGQAARKAMQILVALGRVYTAQCMVPVTSVQVAGVSYDNLGEAGLEFLDELAATGGKARVLATLNPAGMDLENWENLGIDPEFASQQEKVIWAFSRMGILPTCTCTPYLVGNLPHFGEHIAWAESSAVVFANSVLGARTNREGGPSALAAALTGCSPFYGFHLDENRRPDITINISAPALKKPNGMDTVQFGALGKVIGEKIKALSSNKVPYIIGIERASLEELKSFCASIATYGGVALFHMQGITPEAERYQPPAEGITVYETDIESAIETLNHADPNEVDFVTLGCPHLSINEIRRLANLLDGKKVQREFWITTSRPVKKMADQIGYTQIIEASGARFATDTCCVVAPIKGRFKGMATDSAKACYYAASKHAMKIRFMPFDEVVQVALLPPSSGRS